MLGAIVSTRFGNRAFNWLERNTVQRVPGYQPVKEIVSYLGKRDQNPFARPVLVTVGEDLRMTGFLADEGPEGTSVFVPTGPNPTTGLILHVSAVAGAAGVDAGKRRAANGHCVRGGFSAAAAVYRAARRRARRKRTNHISRPPLTSAAEDRAPRRSCSIPSSDSAVWPK